MLGKQKPKTPVPGLEPRAPCMEGSYHYRHATSANPSRENKNIIYGALVLSYILIPSR